MTIIRLKHHDNPEFLRRQLEKKFNTATVEILKVNEKIAEIRFDDREEPWKHFGEIEGAIANLMEENEWIYHEEVIG